MVYLIAINHSYYLTDYVINYYYPTNSFRISSIHSRKDTHIFLLYSSMQWRSHILLLLVVLLDHCILNQNFLRMANWAKLVKQAVDAEIPSYEMLRTLAQFLDMVKNDSQGDAIIKRLSTFFQFPGATQLSIKWYRRIINHLPFLDGVSETIQYGWGWVEG